MQILKKLVLTLFFSVLQLQGSSAEISSADDQKKSQLLDFISKTADINDKSVAVGGAVAGLTLAKGLTVFAPAEGVAGHLYAKTQTHKNYPKVGQDLGKFDPAFKVGMEQKTIAKAAHAGLKRGAICYLIAAIAYGLTGAFMVNHDLLEQDEDNPLIVHATEKLKKSVNDAWSSTPAPFAPSQDLVDAL